MLAALKMFKKLKRLRTCASILVYYNPTRRIMLECNISRFAVEAILSQLVDETAQWHPVVFWSRKMVLTEKNYLVKEAKMLAIVKTCKH